MYQPLCGAGLLAPGLDPRCGHLATLMNRTRALMSTILLLAELPRRQPMRMALSIAELVHAHLAPPLHLTIHPQVI